MRAILFDLDNTLADRRRAFGRYAFEFFQRYSGRLSPAQRADAARWMARIDQDGSLPREEFCRQVARQFPELGLDAAGIWRDHSERLWAYYEPQPEVTALTKRLARKFRLAVVTNGSGLNQRRKLARVGLAPHFKVVVVSGEIGIEKPDSRIFAQALDAVGAAPEDALFVGDDPQRDILGAARAGMATCWIRLGAEFPEGWPKPDVTIDHVVELEGVLACSMPAP